MKHKIFTLLLTAYILYTSAFAQPLISGQKTFGGSDYDGLSSMYLTKDHGLIAGGPSRSNISGEKTENSRGYEDYWIVKFDNFKKIQWDKTIGGSSIDNLSSLQQTRDGGYILGGTSASNISGEKTENNTGSDDYWIVKLDVFGNIQWDKTIGGSSYNALTALQQTSDGGYILGGYSDSNISGEKTENSRGGLDYWIVKIDSLGNIQWDKTIGGSGQDRLTFIEQTTDSEYILGGSSGSNISGEKSENSRGNDDYWIVKLNTFGKIQWDKTIGSSGFEVSSRSFEQTSDGGYIVGGSSWSDISGEKTENGRGSYDYWLVKLNAFGKIQWDKTIGGSRTDILQNLQQTTDGGYILGGYSESNISAEKTENSRGSNDYWVVKLNKNGIVQWDKTIGGSASDYCNSIIEITRNHYILGGSSSSGISGDKTQSSRGGTDRWVVELVYKKPGSFDITEFQNENNIAAPKINSSNFTVYPNPAKNILHIQTNGEVIFTLTNQSGKILLTKTITNKGEINVSNLAAGLYYLKNNTKGSMQKVLVTK